MDSEAIIGWHTQSTAAINLLSSAISLAMNETTMDDISLLGLVGNHIIDVADFARIRVPPPTDPVQQVHWSQLVAQVHVLGIEITKSATLTFDVTPTVAMMQQITREINALGERVEAANTHT